MAIKNMNNNSIQFNPWSSLSFTFYTVLFQNNNIQQNFCADHNNPVIDNTFVFNVNNSSLQNLSNVYGSSSISDFETAIYNGILNITPTPNPSFSSPTQLFSILITEAFAISVTAPSVFTLKFYDINADPTSKNMLNEAIKTSQNGSPKQQDTDQIFSNISNSLSLNSPLSSDSWIGEFNRLRALQAFNDLSQSTNDNFTNLGFYASIFTKRGISEIINGTSGTSNVGKLALEGFTPDPSNPSIINQNTSQLNRFTQPQAEQILSILDILRNEGNFPHITQDGKDINVNQQINNLTSNDIIQNSGVSFANCLLNIPINILNDILIGLEQQITTTTNQLDRLNIQIKKFALSAESEFVSLLPTKSSLSFKFSDINFIDPVKKAAVGLENEVVNTVDVNVIQPFLKNFNFQQCGSDYNSLLKTINGNTKNTTNAANTIINKNTKTMNVLNNQQKILQDKLNNSTSSIQQIKTAITNKLTTSGV